MYHIFLDNNSPVTSNKSLCYKQISEVLDSLANLEVDSDEEV